MSEERRDGYAPLPAGGYRCLKCGHNVLLRPCPCRKQARSEPRGDEGGEVVLDEIAQILWGERPLSEFTPENFARRLDALRARLTESPSGERLSTAELGAKILPRLNESPSGETGPTEDPRWRGPDADSRCHECGSSVWYNVWVSDEVWELICPEPYTEGKGGVLCTRCIDEACYEAELEDVPARIHFQGWAIKADPLASRAPGAERGGIRGRTVHNVEDPLTGKLGVWCSAEAWSSLVSPNTARKAWVRASANLKACPDCGAETLEGLVHCSECGCEPDDDVSWRNAEHDFAGAERASEGEREFNLNHNVGVRLNDHGWKMFEHAYGGNVDWLKDRVDEDGYAWVQFHDLAHTLGPALAAGFNPPCETTIRLASRESPPDEEVTDE